MFRDAGEAGQKAAEHAEIESKKTSMVVLQRLKQLLIMSILVQTAVVLCRNQSTFVSFKMNLGMHDIFGVAEKSSGAIRSRVMKPVAIHTSDGSLQLLQLLCLQGARCYS